MLTWLSANWANILVVTGLVLLIGLIVFRMIRSRKAGKRACGCDCAACAACGACEKARKGPGAER
ncbi:MAG: FeoB-associated Cys-rich membrane protein [Clostridia bacterium]|nr:FeoB-associated Cys-rich membrane protein [Clostridia bacterium]